MGLCVQSPCHSCLLIVAGTLCLFHAVGVPQTTLLIIFPVLSSLRWQSLATGVARGCHENGRKITEAGPGMGVSLDTIRLARVYDLCDGRESGESGHREYYGGAPFPSLITGIF